MSSHRRNIEFITIDGVTLRGWFYSAEKNQSNGKKSPCIIMAGGLTGLKEQFLPLYAQRFQAAGYGVLLYDHRNWGQSDGAPRNETNPIQQARDYSDAFDKAASLEEVDETKIIFWGTSMSGGAVIHAAAFDKRIKAVIAQVPFVSGEDIEFHLGPVFESIHDGRQEQKRGKPPALLKLFPVVTELAEQGDQSALINDPNLSGFLEALGDQKSSWSPYVTPQTMLNVLAFEPQAFVHRIAPTPLFMVIGDTDRTAPTRTQLKAFASAYEPKKLVILEHTGHFDPYHGISFEKNIRVQIEYLSGVFA